MIEIIADPANIILAISVIGAFMTILLFGLPLLATDNLSSRLKAVAKRREELSAVAKKKHEPSQSSIRLQTGRGYMRSVVDRFKLVNPTESETIRILLSQAGMRGQGPLYTYAFFRFLGPLILGLAAIVYFFVLSRSELTFTWRLIWCASAVFIGFYLPKMFVKNAISKRQQAITKGFPNALDLMVICVEAGLSMEAAFSRVASEIQNDSPELAEEIGLTTAEMAFLPDRAQALEGLAVRTGLNSVKSLVTSLVQAEKYGTPVSMALKVISQETRDQRMAKAEKKAGALPAQLTVPMIVFFLPVLFVVILGPAVLKTLKILNG